MTDNADRFGGGSEMIRDGDPDHLWEQMETAMRFVIMSARYAQVWLTVTP